MESNLNIIYLILGIAVIVFSAIGGLFYKIYAFGKEKAEEQTSLTKISEELSTLKDFIKKEIQNETDKVRQELKLADTEQKGNNKEQEKEINSLKEKFTELEKHINKTLVEIFDKVNNINIKLTEVATIQQTTKSTRGVTRGK